MLTAARPDDHDIDGGDEARKMRRLSATCAQESLHPRRIILRCVAQACEQLLLPEVRDAAANEVLLGGTSGNSPACSVRASRAATPMSTPTRSSHQRPWGIWPRPSCCVHHRLRIVAVQIGELVGLVVGKNEFRFSCSVNKALRRAALQPTFQPLELP